MPSILAVIAIIAVLILIIHIGESVTVGHRIRYVETSFTSPKIQPQLNGYVIAFITDPHNISHKKLGTIVDKVNGRQVDLLLLGGDYPHKNAVWPN